MPIQDEIDLLSDEHLRWLVSSRTRNQQFALDLHLLIKLHEDKIRERHNYSTAIHHLVSINFSLWRAVFLSDVHESSEYILRDAKSFLKNLIANNAVAYPQDRNAREWTFLYYMENAQDRLRKMVAGFPEVLPENQFANTAHAQDKLWWEESQISSERALANLRRLLEA